MPTTITIDTKPLRALLARFSRRAHNIPAIAPKIGAVGIAEIHKNFTAGGRFYAPGSAGFNAASPMGGGVQRWTPSIPARAGLSRTLLRKRRLYNSITYRIQGNQIIFYSTFWWAAILHDGGFIQAKNVKYLTFSPTGDGRSFVKKTRVRIPARPFLTVPPSGGLRMTKVWIADIISK